MNRLPILYSSPVSLAEREIIQVERHTFVTTVTLANDISLQNVSKMMGHSSTKTTRHYARVFDQNIFADMQGVEARMAGITKL